jgi:2-methylcitrate dehydratase PrpD
MSNLTEELARFVTETRWEQLPEPVVKEARLLMLDSIGCALGGITTDPGKMVITLARRLGGPEESSIIGTGYKVSCSNAAFANGQLINTLDFDGFTPGSHTPAYILPPALAIAESKNASGKDLILAMTIGFELAGRISGAMRGALVPGPDGKTKKPDRQGYAHFNFGAVAGAAKLLNLDKDKMSHALGIAGHLSQVLTWMRYSLASPRGMTKYGVPGWQNTGAVMAALLAEMGYMGDTSVFDPEIGFWKFCGYSSWNPEKITEGLGEKWGLTEAKYKPYPCCSHFIVPLECFRSIMRKNNLRPDDIDGVSVYGHPDFDIPAFSNRELKNIVDFQFGPAYVFAVAAHDVAAGAEWQDMDMLQTPKIQELAKKVNYQAHPEFGQRQIVRVEVTAGGKMFEEEKTYSQDNGPWGDLRLTEKDIIDKFRHNASRILTRDKTDRAVNIIMELDKVESVPEIMDEVTL